ncbi:MAG TPA: hypothetical protein VFG74_11445 [Miltoncostaeaceae bacterium]|nr:hypothetical protein [Miltoncostaeaceae bacterium]
MRVAAVILALALALGGCGGSADEREAGAAPVPKGDWGPRQPGSGERARPVAPPRKAPPAAVARQLEAGTVGVVGVEGAIGVRPYSLEVSADGTLEDLRWQRWDAGGAEGSGTLEVRDCDPSCASGGKDAYAATIKLSAPRLCGRETYFDQARVRLAADDVPTPTTYVRAPC